MAHWNYRLVQHEDHVSMIEAYYDDKNHLYAWADVGPVIGDDVEDFKGELANRQLALDAPVIPVTYLNELLADQIVTAHEADRCVHCGKAVHNEMHDGHIFVIDDETGGDVCGTWGTFTNEPHEVAVAGVEYTDDECPQCGRVLGVSNGHTVCDNCGWGYPDTNVDEDVLRGDR